MSLSPVTQRLNRALCVLAMTLAWVPGGSGAALAREPTKYHLHIESQPLAEALQEFARQSGVQIIFFSRLTEGLQSPGVQGRHTLQAALTLLLSGSRLTFRVINPKTVEIRPLPASTSVEKTTGPQALHAGSTSSRNNSSKPRGGPAPVAAIEEVVVNGTAQGLVATRTRTPLREIPQTVSIVSREQMRQQNDSDLMAALSRAPGITTERNSSLSQNFFSRGFAITQLHLDGGAPVNVVDTTTSPFFGTPDLSEFDHIELLRGADALFGGESNPGATINLVRKRPLSSPEVTVSAHVGSWSDYRVETDLSGPLALGGALRGRLDGVYAHRNYFYEKATLARKNIFGALEYDVTPATRLTAGGSYRWDDALPFVSGLPRFPDGTDPRLPRDTALTFDWAHYDTRTRELYAQFEQNWREGWALRLNGTWLRGTADYNYGTFQSEIDPLSHGLLGPPSALYTTRPNKQKQFAADMALVGAFNWFGRRQEFALGGDYSLFTGRQSLGLWNAYTALVGNIHEFDSTLYADPRQSDAVVTVSGSRTRASKSGVFASFKAHLSDALSVSGGARYSRDQDRAVVIYEFGPNRLEGTARFRNPGKVTPYAAVMYQLDAHYSLYASYADVYQSFALARRVDGRLLGPADGVNIEAGLKGAWHGGALNGTLVLYQIRQRGVPLADSRTSLPGSVGTNCCYQPGTNRSEGVDAELNGQVAPGWLIGAGYTLNVNGAAAGGELHAATPRHLLKLWTSQQLPGRASRFVVGGSLRAQTRNLRSATLCALPAAFGQCGVPLQSFDVEQRAYAVLDLRAGYQIGSRWQGALSVNNVLDRVFYETLGLPRGNNWYGEPRNVVFRIDGRY